MATKKSRQAIHDELSAVIETELERGLSAESIVHKPKVLTLIESLYTPEKLLASALRAIVVMKISDMRNEKGQLKYLYAGPGDERPAFDPDPLLTATGDAWQATWNAEVDERSRQRSGT